MKTTNSKIKELCENLQPIDTTGWNWDYDCGEAFIDTEVELCVYDDKDNDYYFLVNFELNRDLEYYIDIADLKLVSAYDSQSNEITLTEYQHDYLLNEIGTIIN